MTPKNAEIEVLKVNHANMAQNIGEIKAMLGDFIRSAETKYATKEDVKITKDDISELEGMYRTLIGRTNGTMAMIIFGLIGVIWANLDKIVK